MLLFNGNAQRFAISMVFLNIKLPFGSLNGFNGIIFFTVYHKLVGPVCIQCTDYENKFWKNLALLIHHCHECQGIKDNDWKLLSYSR